jgi:ABC-type transport system involved in cytochrome c biogenesis permease component
MTTIPTGSAVPGGLAPRPAAAPRGRVLATQTAAEIRMTLRNGEQLLLTLVIPLVLLVALSHLPESVVGHSPAIDAVAPGILALSVLSTAFTGQAIATGFERRYGILRLLGTTPLGRSGLVIAKTAGVLVVEAIQVVLVSAVAFALGWHPVGDPVSALVLILLGTAAFSALGLLLSGTGHPGGRQRGLPAAAGGRRSRDPRRPTAVGRRRCRLAAPVGGTRAGPARRAAARLDPPVGSGGRAAGLGGRRGRRDLAHLPLVVTRPHRAAA